MKYAFIVPWLVFGVRSRARPAHTAPAYWMSPRVWDQEEDAILIQHVAGNERPQWVSIAKRLNGRTPAMCRNRFRRIRSVHTEKRANHLHSEQASPRPEVLSPLPDRPMLQGRPILHQGLFEFDCAHTNLNFMLAAYVAFKRAGEDLQRV